MNGKAFALSQTGLLRSASTGREGLWSTVNGSPQEPLASEVTAGSHLGLGEKVKTNENSSAKSLLLSEVSETHVGFLLFHGAGKGLSEQTVTAYFPCFQAQIQNLLLF